MFSCGFYNSLNGDRKYSAIQFGEMFDGLITDGIYATIGEAFGVTPGAGLGVVVGTGRAWFNKTWSVNDAALPLSLEMADLLLPRIDMVVLEVDTRTAVRDNCIKVVTGTPAVTPEKPALVSENGLYQYPLAYISVAANQDTVAKADIENMMGRTPCPFVTGILQSISIDDAFLQWEGQFEEWFANVQAQLSGDIAANLQRQVDELKTSLEEDVVLKNDKATSQEAISGTDGSKWIAPDTLKSATNNMLAPYQKRLVGEIRTIPFYESGALTCAGQYVNKQSYSALYSKIGDSFGFKDLEFLTPNGSFSNLTSSSSTYKNWNPQLSYGFMKTENMSIRNDQFTFINEAKTILHSYNGSYGGSGDTYYRRFNLSSETGVPSFTTTGLQNFTYQASTDAYFDHFANPQNTYMMGRVIYNDTLYIFGSPAEATPAFNIYKCVGGSKPTRPYSYNFGSRCWVVGYSRDGSYLYILIWASTKAIGFKDPTASLNLICYNMSSDTATLLVLLSETAYLGYPCAEIVGNKIYVKTSTISGREYTISENNTSYIDTNVSGKLYSLVTFYGWLERVGNSNGIPISRPLQPHFNSPTHTLITFYPEYNAVILVSAGSTTCNIYTLDSPVYNVDGNTELSKDIVNQSSYITRTTYKMINTSFPMLGYYDGLYFIQQYYYTYTKVVVSDYTSGSQQNTTTFSNWSPQMMRMWACRSTLSNNVIYNNDIEWVTRMANDAGITDIKHNGGTGTNNILEPYNMKYVGWNYFAIFYLKDVTSASSKYTLYPKCIRLQQATFKLPNATQTGYGGNINDPSFVKIQAV